MLGYHKYLFYFKKTYNLEALLSFLFLIFTYIPSVESLNFHCIYK